MRQAQDIKIGDIINIDCGYGAPDFQDCEVIGIDYVRGLFEDEECISFWVKAENAEMFHTMSFDLRDEI